MKKLILTLMLLAPILLMGQRVYTDTLSVATDTIIRYRVFDPNFQEGWYFYAETLAGTPDATIQIVVANDPSSNGYPTDPALISDDLFMEYNAGLSDTLTAVGPYAFQYRYIPFDYVGAKITINGVTTISMPFKRITKSQNK